MKRIIMSFTVTALIVFGLYAVHETARAGADSTLYYDADDNVAMMQEFVDAVTYVEEKFDTGNIVITTEWLDGNTIAQMSMDSIRVNKAWTTGAFDIYAADAADVAAGYHPGGCNPIVSTAFHEAAHILDARSGYEARYELQAAHAMGGVVLEELSGYSFEGSALNIPEALANAFQAYECGVATPAEAQLYNMLAYW